ncbi:MAG: hypothetical protein HY327_12760 [Chloroflexi bacterium]|nr:hypothetical protein [Chloroflexota bacterium]
MKKSNQALPATQDQVLVESVRDKAIILRTGEMTALVQVEGVDVTRLSNDAQIGLVAQFESFLLTLRFPYQIIIARKRQRLEEFLSYVDDQAQQRGRERNPVYTRALYGWIQFMNLVVQQVNPQIPHYLFVVPYDPIPYEERVRGKPTLTLERYRRGLDELARRTDQVVRGMTRVGLGCRRLDNQEITAVLHRVYHPSIPDHRIPPIVRAKSFVASTDVVGPSSGT